MSANCDSIYVDAEKNLVCKGKYRDREVQKVNLNYLRFLNRHKKCFADGGLYDPLRYALLAEQTFYSCVYGAQGVPTKNPLSLCSLNQLLFADSPVKPLSKVDFWMTDFEGRFNNFRLGAGGFDCVDADFVTRDRP